MGDKYKLKKFLITFFISCFTLILFSSSSVAQIVVPNYFQIFKNTDKPIRNMVVKNHGKAPLIVNTQVNESVINDDGTESLVVSKGLIVAPKNFSLGAGEQKNIRIFVRKSKENMERFFKITFYPKPLTSENDFQQYGDDEKSIGIRIVTGMIASVYVEPNEREIDIKVKRTEAGVEFKNDGNYHTRIFDMNICDNDILNTKCKKLDDFITLRPKQKRVIALKKKQRLFYKEKQVVKGTVYEKSI